jgi:hypothetical protein
MNHTARLATEKAVFRPALPLCFLPESTGGQMAKLTFAEQIKHPNWQRKRLEVMEDAGFECESCGTNEVTLNVHHKRYIKGRMYWDYERTDLSCLCEDCHKQEHASRELLDRLISEAGSGGMDIMLGLAAGYLLASMDIDRELAEEIQEGRGLYFEVGIVATTLDRGDGFKWRKTLIEHVKTFPGNPVTEYYADLWKQEMGE